MSSARQFLPHVTQKGLEVLVFERWCDDRDTAYMIERPSSLTSQARRDLTKLNININLPEADLQWSCCITSAEGNWL
ncbi:hypothetical protein J6590_047090 [Homalodisca vitripennis]|nr:hypothetical protein J6590_047090 [Homalodisca vitripennis]